MIEYQNLTLIGTSHISTQSIKEVRETIFEQKPAFVALELDKGRLIGLMGKKQRLKIRSIRKLGLGGFLFAFFGSWISTKLGKVVGTKPGDEMKTAVLSAIKVKSRIALIDQEISITIRRLIKQITWKEKFRFVGDLVKGLVFRKQEIKPFDLRKVPSEELINIMVQHVEKRYPSVYKVLIDERNKYMAKKLIHLMQQYPEDKIIAVVGAGHQKGMIELIKKSISAS
jgi:pheromone shutdown-related protein TraB